MTGSICTFKFFKVEAFVLDFITGWLGCVRVRRARALKLRSWQSDDVAEACGRRFPLTTALRVDWLLPASWSGSANQTYER